MVLCPLQLYYTVFGAVHCATVWPSTKGCNPVVLCNKGCYCVTRCTALWLCAPRVQRVQIMGKAWPRTARYNSFWPLIQSSALNSILRAILEAHLPSVEGDWVWLRVSVIEWLICFQVESLFVTYFWGNIKPSIDVCERSWTRIWKPKFLSYNFKAPPPPLSSAPTASLIWNSLREEDIAGWGGRAGGQGSFLLHKW